jgi:ABC-type polysaccharide/polyol phosphate export permease
MSQYVAAIWKCRYFWLSLVRMDLRGRYRRSMLGLGWSLLHPIVLTTVLCVVFPRIWNDIDVRSYAPMLLVGLCFWSFITTTTLGGCQCLHQGERYIRQFPAPMAIYPLRTVLGSSFHFGMALLVVIALRFLMIGFSGVSSFASLVPTCMLLFVLGWSMSLIAGFATAYFPDVQHLSEVGLQILFYATPIIYPADKIQGKLGALLSLNPFSTFVELFREPLLHGHWPSLTQFGVALRATYVIAAVAALTAARLQKKVIFQL